MQYGHVNFQMIMKMKVIFQMLIMAIVSVVFLALLFCFCKIGFCLLSKLSGNSSSEDVENNTWNDVYLTVR